MISYAPHCDEHGTTVCGCGLSVGEMHLRGGVLCLVDGKGRLNLRAPRRADAIMARRVVATMRGATDDVSKQLVANLKGIGTK